jgi:hypothetical protein
MPDQAYRLEDDTSTGRVDVYGNEWFACDPYPTWYRWVGGILFTEEYPIEWMDGHGS